MYHTFNELKTKFWLEQGSCSVRSCMRKCLVCQKRNGKLGEQIISDLPLARLDIGQAPFTRTGVDFFGPIYVKRGRSEEKRYRCIFTCMSTRAVHIETANSHIETANSLSTESFLMALERFVARRRHVQHLYSDNGTDFIGAEKVIRDYIVTWNQRQIYNLMLKLDIEWHFNTSPTFR